MVRAVLADLDDTLFDHYRGTRIALDAVRASEPAFAGWSIDDLETRHRVALEAWHVRVMAGEFSIDDARVGRFQELLEMAAASTGPLEGGVRQRAAAVARTYRQTYETAWHVVPGALDLVLALKRAGLPVVIVTNNIVVEQELKLARCGLTAHVDALVTSEEIGFQKPDPKIFEAALAKAGVASRDAVMLGDAWHADIAGAIAAGIRPVWFNRFGAASPDSRVAELHSLEPTERAIEVILAL